MAKDENVLALAWHTVMARLKYMGMGVLGLQTQTLLLELEH